MSDIKTSAIILAAGEGTRMRSQLPKVLHAVAHRPMIGHIITTAKDAGCQSVCVVVGPQSDAVCETVKDIDPQIQIAVQHDRLGTADAVLAARSFIQQSDDEYIIVLLGDTPLIQPDLLAQVHHALRGGTTVAVVGFRAEDPTGYGRMVEVEGRLVSIVEERDATTEERQIDLCNAGIMGFSRSEILPLLEKIKNDNIKGEFYLTDIVEIANQSGLTAVSIESNPADLVGVNDKAQLAHAESCYQNRLRERMLKSGITMMDPETVYLACDTEIGANVIIEPHVFFGPGVQIGDGCRIRAFSHLEGCAISSDASIGPFARIRPGTQVDDGAYIGNFVELKNTQVGKGGKIPHLSYVGDATIGALANIGAGTITCNYNGYEKNRTEVGVGAFIGSNSALVAPIRVGDWAIVGAGSTLSGDDIDADALVTNRADRKTILNGARALHEKLSARTGKLNKRK